jgi:hypothetical protein
MLRFSFCRRLGWLELFSQPLQLSHFVDIVKILTANNLEFRSCEMNIRIKDGG